MGHFVKSKPYRGGDPEGLGFTGGLSHAADYLWKLENPSSSGSSGPDLPVDKFWYYSEEKGKSCTSDQRKDIEKAIRAAREKIDDVWMDVFLYTEGVSLDPSGINHSLLKLNRPSCSLQSSH